MKVYIQTISELLENRRLLIPVLLLLLLRKQVPESIFSVIVLHALLGLALLLKRVHRAHPPAVHLIVFPVRLTLFQSRLTVLPGTSGVLVALNFRALTPCTLHLILLFSTHFWVLAIFLKTESEGTANL